MPLKVNLAHHPLNTLCVLIDLGPVFPQDPVTARKDDAPAADQAVITNVVGWMVFSGGSGLIQTTSG